MRHSELKNLNPDLLLALAQANEEYKAQTGEDINFTSGHRTFERQKQIYATARPGYAAKPGGSVHESDAQGVANAVDIDPQQVRRVAKTGVLDKFGLYRPLLNNPKAPEDWHIEHVGGPRGGRSVGGSPIRITPAESQIQAQIEPQPQGTTISFEKGGRSYMDPSMLAAGGFGASIPGLDVGGLSEGIAAGKNTQQDFLGQILEALGSYGKKGASGAGVGGLGGMIGGMAGGPVGAAVGAGVGELGGDIIKLVMMNKADKMARQHAGWLQDIAVNPPRPGWAREMSGPGLNK